MTPVREVKIKVKAVYYIISTVIYMDIFLFTSVRYFSFVSYILTSFPSVTGLYRLGEPD